MSAQNPTADEIKAQPWRYVGYSGFAKWVAYDNDYLILRRFDCLAAQVLLRKQWQLSKLEAELFGLHSARSHSAQPDIHNGSFELNDDQRELCLRKADEQLKQYYECVNLYISLRDKPDASSQTKRHIRKWLAHWNDAAIEPKEAAYIEDGDLFALHETTRAPLRQVFEKFATSHIKPDFQPGLSPPDANADHKSDPDAKINRHHARMRFLSNFVICTVGFVMLVAPMWILIYLDSRQLQLAVITVFVFTFLALVQLVTLARPFESLAATAAYSAVLIVFLQTTPVNFYSHS